MNELFHYNQSLINLSIAMTGSLTGMRHSLSTAVVIRFTRYPQAIHRNMQTFLWQLPHSGLI